MAHRFDSHRRLTWTRALAGLLWLICVPSGEAGESAEGPLTGRVVYQGPAIPDRVADVTRDADHCGKTSITKTLFVQQQTGGLANAVVSIEPASSQATAAPVGTAAPLVISNSRCSFAPRISVGQVGQLLEVRNDDPILHNTHITADRRTFINVALVPGGRPVRKPVTQPGLYSIACDAHKFMTAHLFVAPHPYVGLTDQAGMFQLPRLEPGTYTMTVWHETLGTIHRSITIPTQGASPLVVDYPKERPSHAE